MMDKVINKDKGTAIYTYNGLDKRVGQTLKRQNSPEEKISYTLDLLKPFKNILERDVNGNKEEYIYDRNILGTIDGGSYLIGRKASIIRSIEKTHEEIYSYDEFGIEDRNVLRSNPFGYTGYQYDDISELNFAEARYYDQNQGRFISEDNIKGFMIYPDSLNDYTYVWNHPLNYVDMDGNLPTRREIAKFAGELAIDTTKDYAKRKVDELKAGGEVVGDKVNRGWKKTKTGAMKAWNSTKVGAKKVNDILEPKVDWVGDQIMKGVGVRRSYEYESVNGTDYLIGDIKGNNFFVRTGTEVENFDRTKGYKSGFEINFKIPFVSGGPELNLSFERGNGEVELSGGFSFGLFSQSLNLVGRDDGWEISGETELQKGEIIYGGKYGFDNEGFFLNSFGGWDVDEEMEILGYTMKSERELYRADWKKVGKVAALAALLIALGIYAPGALSALPALIPPEYVEEFLLIFEGLSQGNLVLADAMDYCEIE